MIFADALKVWMSAPIHPGMTPLPQPSLELLLASVVSDVRRLVQRLRCAG